MDSTSFPFAPRGDEAAEEEEEGEDDEDDGEFARVSAAAKGLPSREGDGS